MVAMLRRALRTREVGHAGTLDPMATGVLVVAIGEATKLVSYLTDAPKEYTARVELGRETDTLDAMGKVIAEQATGASLLAALEQSQGSPLLARAIAGELARTLQEPPAYSAIQQDGERAYARARRGEEVVLPARPIHVHRLTLTACGVEPAPWLELRVKADKGYYVRALGRDLARALGTVGTVTELRRVDAGGFTERDAIAVPADRDALLARLVPLAEAARRALPSATLSAAGVTAARFGQRVPCAEFVERAAMGEPAAWFDAEGALVAIGVEEEAGADGGEARGKVLRGFA